VHETDRKREQEKVWTLTRRPNDKKRGRKKGRGRERQTQTERVRASLSPLRLLRLYRSAVVAIISIVACVKYVSIRTIAWPSGVSMGEQNREISEHTVTEESNIKS